MANTTFRLTASKADTPISGDNPGANPTSTPTSTKPGSANTGFNTEVSRDIINTVSSPIVSGTFLFIGFILLLALIIKIKKNKQAAFDAGLNKNRYTTRILGFATFLALIAGIGGTAARFIGAKADAELTDITTSREVIVNEPVEVTDDYGIYCGQDTITLNGDSTAGYYLFMYADDDGVLSTTTSGITNIASAEDWDGLGIGEWGYYVGSIADRESATTNPMPLGYSIIDSKNTATTAGTIPVTYCAKISRNVEEAEFSTTINYEVLAKETGEIYPEADFNSSRDDDGDGISNREENRYGMNPLSADSDMDSLSDYDELKTYHTDPLTEDTDGDGLYDYSEVALSKDDRYNFNPTVADYNGETLEYTEEIEDGLSIVVTGTGNIPLTYVGVSEPGNIDESLDGVSGKAYGINSAGEITSGNIIVDAVPTTGTAGQDEDDNTLGGVQVSDNFDAEDLNTYAITFSEEGVDEDDEITATVADITPTVSNNKISIPVTGNSIIVVSDSSINTSGSDDETLGASLLSSIKKAATKKATNTASGSASSSEKREKIANVITNIYTKTKSFVAKVVNACIETQCVSKTIDMFIELWQVFFGGSGGGGNTPFTPSTHGFAFSNPAGYANNTDLNNASVVVVDNGECYGMALLARLLYLGKINTSKNHTVSIHSSAAIINKMTGKKANINSFNLNGKSASQILGATDLLTQGDLITGDVGQALLVLQHSQFNNNHLWKQSNSVTGTRKLGRGDGTVTDADLERVSKTDFIEDLKSKVKDGDPAVLGIASSSSGIDHAVNLLYIGLISSSSGVEKYNIKVYDPNHPKQETEYTMECNKNEDCVINGLPVFLVQLHNDSVFK